MFSKTHVVSMWRKHMFSLCGEKHMFSLCEEKHTFSLCGEKHMFSLCGEKHMFFPTSNTNFLINRSRLERQSSTVYICNVY